MAATLLRGLSCLTRALGWWIRQPILVTQSTAVVPVRTKKRFTPPTYELKYRTQKEFLEHARKSGLVIPPERLERPIHLASTASIFDAYIPPEGDARMSALSKEGLKQKTERLKKNVTSQLSIRKIREYDANFKIRDFPEKAKDIFIEAHLCLNNSDHDRLHTLVTEHCFPDMVWDLRYKTVRWHFVESLEPAQVTQVRCSSLVNQSNMYGQVTVRLHTRQTLAIYDRFGRLMYGQEDMPKDVLEYVVFERHLMNPYGSWRMHAKIVPPWAPPKQPILKTVMIPGPQLQPWEDGKEGPAEAPSPQLA
ncbi:39S ribosomal protein L45, mitochondrial [Heterocephalus glaber]|uniref:Large ribosomal subunit protein mL45 n=1 Tax=Heterocephalus glaber TaxID=10181 RepID=G5BY31_HETGA|nr:39S ribosomal protein L45, mitochondrial isoform X2 [Heterocephalus glaber]EHB14192.1 39S ribosomal protein L45, mitochondrial [Heterocephalus glaber]